LRYTRAGRGLFGTLAVGWRGYCSGYVAVMFVGWRSDGEKEAWLLRCWLVERCSSASSVSARPRASSRSSAATPPTTPAVKLYNDGFLLAARFYTEFSACLVPSAHRPSRQRCPRYLPTASRAAPLSSSHPAQGIDSARACTPTTHTPDRALLQLPNHTPRLGTRCGTYPHTTQVHRELFPQSYRPPCLNPSKSLTPQSAPSTRAAARLYVLQMPLRHLCEKTPANRRFLTAKNCASHAQPGRIPRPRTLHPALLTLAQFKENPDAWLLVDKILQDAQYPQTKCKWVAGQWLGCHAANVAQTWDCRFSTMSS
jgi:hypothetical protein